MVEVCSGNERGTRGQVQRVVLAKNRVVVQGVNVVKRHQRRTAGVRTQTGIIEFEAPIHLSNVMPVCPACDTKTRVGFTVTDSGAKVRVCRRCGGILD